MTLLKENLKLSGLTSKIMVLGRITTSKKKYNINKEIKEYYVTARREQTIGDLKSMSVEGELKLIKVGNDVESVECKTSEAGGGREGTT